MRKRHRAREGDCERGCTCEKSVLLGVLMSMWFRDSVTRWLNYLFNIWPFRTMKNWPIVKIFVKVGSQFGHILNILSRNGRILFLIFPKWQNFAKSGHTVQRKERASKFTFKKKRKFFSCSDALWCCFSVH